MHAVPQLLLAEPRDWQRSLDVLRLCWVADPRALAQQRPHLLCHDLAAPTHLAARLVLQACLRLSAAAVYDRLPGSMTTCEAEKLVCRLLFLEQQQGAAAVAQLVAGHEEVEDRQGTGKAPAQQPCGCWMYARSPTQPLPACCSQQL